MMVTVEEAANILCPMTFNASSEYGPERQMCLGPQCMAWRYKDHATDDAWTAAVRKAADELNDATPGRTKATQAVRKDRAKYGLPVVPERGWCGLAGKPEWWPK